MVISATPSTFFLAEDRDGVAFRFAPLSSATLPATLPDSLAVQTPEHDYLIRSAAVLYLLQRLGGIWQLLALVAALIPLKLRDAMYDLIARNRYRIAAKPNYVCPMLPAHLRARFDY